MVQGRIYDGTRNAILASLPNIGPIDLGRGLAVDSLSGIVYAANPNGTVMKIDGATNEILGTVQVASPRGLAVNPVNKRVYVASSAISSLSVICPDCTDQPPVANVGPSNPTAILGEWIQFYGTGSFDRDGTITSYDWNFGDGTTASGISADHLFASPGSFTVTLTVTDNGGLRAQTRTTATILTASQAIQSLTLLVESFNLAQGISNSLDSKLANALDALNSANAGQRMDAVNKLQAFINAVQAQSGNTLTPDQANQLVALAQRILATL